MRLAISLVADMPAHRIRAELVAYNSAIATCLRFSFSACKSLELKNT